MFKSLRSSTLRPPARGERLPLLAALALAAGVVAQLCLPADQPLPPDPGLAPRRLRMPAPMQTPDYPAVLARPIFTPGRTPGETAGGGGGGGGLVAASVQLAGIALSGRAGSAVVVTPDGKTSVIRPGQTVQGWRLIGLSADQAVFLGPSGRSLLTLGAKAATSTSPPAPR